jgi:RHS repeat-associated protein
MTLPEILNSYFFLENLKMGNEIRIMSLRGAGLLGGLLAMLTTSMALAQANPQNYDLSQLRNLSVACPSDNWQGSFTASGMIPSKGCGACPVRVQFTITATVDKSDDQEDCVTMGGVFCMNSAYGARDQDGFNAQSKTATVTVDVTPGVPVVLSLSNCDGDSPGSAKAQVTSVSLAPGSGCSTCGNFGSGAGAPGCFSFAMGLGTSGGQPVGSLGFVVENANAKPSIDDLRYNGWYASSFAQGWPTSPSSIPNQTHYDGLIAGMDVVVATNQYRQIKTDQGLVNLISNDTGYEAQFYEAANVVAKVGGLYAVVNQPLVIWRFMQPTVGAPWSIQEVRGTTTNTTTYTENGSSSSYTRGTGSEAVTEVRTVLLSQKDANGVTTNEIVETVIQDTASTVCSKTRQQQILIGGALHKILEVIDPDGLNLTKRWWYNAKGMEVASLDYNGAWQVLQYTNATLPDIVTRIITPWKNSPFNEGLLTGSAAESAYCVRTIDRQDSLGLLTPEYITTRDYLPGADAPYHYEENIRPVCGTDLVVSNLVYPGDGTCLTSGSLTVDGQVVMSFRPDGLTTLFSRSIAPVSGNVTETTAEGVPNADRSAIHKGTRTVRITTSTGALVSECRYAIPEEHLLSSTTVTQRDAVGRPLQTVYLDGTTAEQTYSCCGLERTRDQDDVYTFNEYDSLKRLRSVTRAGETTSYDYDACGRQIATWRLVDNAYQLVSRTIYDRAGRVVATVDNLNRTNTFSEVVTPAGFTIRTTTSADGSTRIERYFRDGQLESVAGTAAHPVRYDYASYQNGFSGTFRVTTETKVGPNGATNEWVKTLTDGAGRAVQTVYADGAFSFNVYNSLGQLVRATDPDGVTSLYAYNASGEQEYTAVCVSPNRQSLMLEGADRVTRTTSDYALRGTEVVRRSVTTVWTNTSAAAFQVVATQDTSLDGTRAWSVSAGRTNFSATLRLGNGWTQSVATNADGSYSLSLTATGRLIRAESRMADGTLLHASSNRYDAANRLLCTMDANGVINSNSYDTADRVIATTIYAPGLPPQTTRQTYDLMGRTATVMQPDGGVVTNDYYTTGELQQTSGSRTYPVAYAYDTQGRMTRLSTWQDFAAQSGRADTHWSYDSRRGWLVAKTYADSNSVTYAYTPAGRLAARTWTRGVQTRYTYDLAGTLRAIIYLDAAGRVSTDTTPVVNSYDRLGRLISVSDASGLRAVQYNEIGAAVLESYTVGPLAGHALTRAFDPLGRLASLGVSSSPVSLDQSVTYGYDSASRLKTITSVQPAAAPTQALLTNQYAYTYAPSGLWTNLATTSNNRLVMNTTRALDGLNRLVTIAATTNSAGVVSSCTYGYDLAGQRTNAALADGTRWSYAYDPLGQVTNGVHARPTGEALLGQSFAYLYDDIGNRKTATRDAASESYSANLLNQYATRTVPNVFDILGEADATTAITVNGTPAQRQERYWRGRVVVDNASAPVYAAVVITGMTTTVTNRQAGTHFVARTPETFGYDSDGNLINDGRLAYFWDAENRLIAAEELSSPSGRGRVRVENRYDSQSRRFRKLVYTRSADLWSLTSDIFFLYDGWNLIREERRPDAKNRTMNYAYTWGLDLSGTPQGAGGIGGLLAASYGHTSVVASVFYTFDGNGNVSDLIADNGNLAAHYEFDPFGNTLVATGPLARENTFRFSTKYTEEETGLVYYGYRYYQPEVGRWVSRDPIEERGGDNVYVFVNNSAILYHDTLGLLCCDGQTVRLDFCPRLWSTVLLSIRYARLSIIDLNNVTQYYDRASWLNAWGLGGSIIGAIGGGAGAARQMNRMPPSFIAAVNRRFYRLVVGSSVGQEGALEVLENLSTIAGWILNPADAAGGATIGIGDDLSRQLSRALRIYEASARDGIAKYRRCCWNTP